MCIILDANLFSDFINPNNEDMQPIRKWLENHGKIAHSPTKKLEKELKKYPKMHSKLTQYTRASKVKNVDKDAVEKKHKSLKDLCSDDEHIIALALVGKVQLLVSKDRRLHKDFSKKVNRGKIYQNKGHKRLLQGYSCP